MAQIRTVTPEEADLLLRLSKLDRMIWGMGAKKTDPQRVALYAQLMKAGQWKPGEEDDPVWLRSEVHRPGIALVGGNHRMTAISTLDTPVDLSVQFNRHYWDMAEIYRQTVEYFLARLHKEIIK